MNNHTKEQAFTEWWSGYVVFPEEGYDANEKEAHMRYAFMAGRNQVLASPAIAGVVEALRDAIGWLSAHAQGLGTREAMQATDRYKGYVKALAALKSTQ